MSNLKDMIPGNLRRDGMTDEALDAFARDRGQPALERPGEAQGAPTTLRQVDPEEDAQGAETTSEATPPPAPPKKAKPKPKRAKTTKKTFELPDYVAKALRIKAAEQGVTERYIVLMGLKAKGIHVDKVDLQKDNRWTIEGTDDE